MTHNYPVIRRPFLVAAAALIPWGFVLLTLVERAFQRRWRNGAPRSPLNQ